MSFWHMMGFGEQKILAQGDFVTGSITAVKKCWWLKVNTKAVRMNMWDGAKFPHIAVFEYEVDGQALSGSRWISYDDMPPAVGAKIKVYYDRKDPAKYAVKL